MLLASLILICAILNRLGGSLNKNWRRFGIGIFLAFMGVIFFHNYWTLLCIGTSQLFRLPVTLKGSSIHDSWFNWVWIFILGFLYGLVPYPYALLALWWQGLAAAGVFALVFGTLAVLSNVAATARFFKWASVEVIYGALIGFMAWVLGRRKK